MPARASLTRHRPPYRAARAFYIAVFFLTCLATFALLNHRPQTPHHAGLQPTLYRRKGDAPTEQLDADDKCRLVHQAHDQCAFVRKNCPDDDGGFTAYLDLYYCKLPHLKPIAMFILISWIGLLFSTIGIAASDFFCIDLSTIAAILGMSESMAGVTFLAFGNGSPDVFSTFAAMSTNSGSLALGELFGAAGFITAVVSGSMALIRPFHVARKSFVRDVGFFIVAAGFSLVFIWDGKLHLWECLAMVGYYFFYVTFVVVWHWWLGRRRQRRQKEAAARGHYVAPEDETGTTDEPYTDDPEENHHRRNSAVQAIAHEDWSALERGDDGNQSEHEVDEEEERDRWMSELASNMRLTKPTANTRGHTVTPVRPSLVGALEFQAVLKSLQRSRNIQTIPMHARRYSDDPYFTTAQQQDAMSTYSDPASRPVYQVVENGPSTPYLERPSLAVPPSIRGRAVSASGALDLHLDPETRRNSLRPSNGQGAGTDVGSTDMKVSRSMLDVPGLTQDHGPATSPSVLIEPATPRKDAPIRHASPEPMDHADRLAIPDINVPSTHTSKDYFVPRPPRRQGTADSASSQATAVPRARNLPKIVIPRESRLLSPSPTLSPFPRYTDSPSPTLSPNVRVMDGGSVPSLTLPSPLATPGSPEAVSSDAALEQEDTERPSRWWPYKVLPPPSQIIATLFPTIYHWSEKTWWEKCLGIVAAPPVFLLTVTLPVVESDTNEALEQKAPTRGQSKDFDHTTTASPRLPRRQSSGGIKLLVPDIHEEEPTPGHHRHSPANVGPPTIISPAIIPANIEHNHHHDEHYPETTPQPQFWNRWLTIIQLFLAPLLIVLAIYLQAPTDLEPIWLLRPCLISILVSLVLLIPLLATTTPTHRPPPYRILLSLAGFVVSIAWISTIASQVVGALKALAVILNMSHAILGLTIFAVGNSLGDLVADVTVARLGYPVMALSACFGGPMLNILLGVGLSGSWMLIRGAEKRKHRHPGEKMKFKTYHIEVERTLIISGITLLLTLVGVLILVPLNKWVFSRRIGWALIVLWTVSTIGNVVVEVSGFGDVD